MHEGVRPSGGVYKYLPETQTTPNRSPLGHARVAHNQMFRGLRRIETVDLEGAKKVGWGTPSEGGGRLALMTSWIEASRASTRVDVWPFVCGGVCRLKRAKNVRGSGIYFVTRI